LFFLDHFGPVELSEHAMNVGPHPHIGLMTITYLYDGAVLHRDSTGAEQIIVPGEVNGMSAGRGVTHSERGKVEDITPHLEERNLEVPTGSHGLQLWMALSREGEDVDPSFHHGKAIALNDHASLVVGKANGHSQMSVPVDPLLGKVAFVDVHFPHADDEFVLHNIGGDGTSANSGDDSLELGVYVSTGLVTLQSGWGKVSGTNVEAGTMLVVKIRDPSSFDGTLQALSPDTRIGILGGSPLPEKRHMLWNFVSASKEKVQKAAEAWDRLDRSVFPHAINEHNPK
jgi:redox-sensitive bicupin YhaK (pirin superfamily)